MKTLAIDCATEACSVALFDGEELAANEHAVLGRGHAERLIPMIGRLPDKGRADRILVSRGPGSFTGVRIGVAAARALGVAWGCPVFGYPTLALVASLARSEAGMQPVSVAMSGGHGEFFVQQFGPDGLPEAAHRSLTPADAVSACQYEIVAGSKAEALVKLRGTGDALALHPDASGVLDLPEALITSDTAPIYGRPPDAKPAAPRVTK